MANVSKERREELLAKISEIRKFIEKSSRDENSSNLLHYLNEIAKDVKGKKYGLVFEEHRESIDEKLETHIPVLVEDEKLFIDNGGEQNFLIEGDNLAALKLLEKTHKGKIDVIYIDPPYNTGKDDFIYDDDFVNADDQFRHSKWCSFITKRLVIARKLLSKTGFIAISIDDNEYSNLKSICDEIFGFENYQSTFHIQVRYAEKSLNEEKPFKPLMEYVLFYSKDFKKFSPKRETVDYGTDNFCFKIHELKKGTKFCVKNQEAVVFKPGEWSIEKIDGNINGLKETWVTGSIYTTMSYGKVFQTIVEPRIKKDGLGCLYKVIGRGDDGLGYRYYTGPAKATAKKGKMYSGIPLEKRTLIESGEAPQRELPILTTYDFAPDFGNIRTEGGVPFGSGKKPIKMIKQFINYHKKSNAVVLDFFAGSASTGHATVALNKDDDGHRTVILCTNNQNNICKEKAYVRMKNVLTKENLLGSLKYFRIDYVPISEKLYYEYADELLLHIRELVELENGINFNNNSEIAIILTDEEMAEFVENNKKKKNLEVKKIYYGHNVLLSGTQTTFLKKHNIKLNVVPDYYYQELEK